MCITIGTLSFMIINKNTNLFLLRHLVKTIITIIVIYFYCDIHEHFTTCIYLADTDQSTQQLLFIKLYYYVNIDAIDVYSTCLRTTNRRT